ncbi:MAG: TfoX/Sxy family protein [Nitrospira sp.]|nr:TfoX/Sxy family protein [Nitrospira sp.]
MAYDERLAERIRYYLKRCQEVEKKRMFGWLCFVLSGHMCCGIENDRLMVRVMPDRYDTLLSKPHAREMDFTGKPLKGFLFIRKLAIARPLVSLGGLTRQLSAQNQSRQRKEDKNIQESAQKVRRTSTAFSHCD